MPTDLTAIHPELRAVWKKFPRLTFNRWTTPLFDWLTRLQPRPNVPAGVGLEQINIPGQDGQHNIRLRVYRPQPLAAPAPVLVWLHGGGFIVGTPEQDDAYAFGLAQEVGIVVVSVDYRLAPRHPFPAALDDCDTALQWVHAHPQPLGIDPRRIAVGGASAGGGLAACLAQRTHDRGAIRLALQLLVYPMLDDRSALRAAVPHAELLTWNQASNRFGWEAYLQQACGSEPLPPYSVAARRADCSGLPPAWIGVGTLDLFHAEDLAYAQKLRDGGVECDLVVVPGAFHGFDALNDQAAVIRDFRQSQMTALRRCL
jgi:acetyl esterase/lipase